MPFCGAVAWEQVMPYLKEIGYEGCLSFELLRASFPDRLVRETLKYLHAVGTELLTMAE